MGTILKSVERRAEVATWSYGRRLKLPFHRLIKSRLGSFLGHWPQARFGRIVRPPTVPRYEVEEKEEDEQAHASGSQDTRTLIHVVVDDDDNDDDDDDDDNDDDNNDDNDVLAR
uniref:Uncharacterized protein n=1 Tax=Vespula pensylvanica TaxID=30213 RepID=A0A834UCS6_VESPE|nr:hypothetical protein H0235_004325 [Vespula pensylvanica]